jgi:hypothetical protein
MADTLCEGLVMNKLTIIILSAFLVTGCASTNSNTSSDSSSANVSNMTQEQWNEILIKSKSPVRLIKDSSDKDAIELIEVWAGIAGESGISQRYQTMAFDNIKKRCGYGKGEFAEFRIVKSDSKTMEEVWLFNDPKSYRADKLSGMTVFLQYDAVTNFIQGELFGKCHTGRGTSLGINN